MPRRLQDWRRDRDRDKGGETEMREEEGQKRNQSCYQHDGRQSCLGHGIVELRRDQAMQDRVLIDVHHSHITAEVDSIDSDGHIIETNLCKFRRATNNEI
jgi:hypothetical protein